MILVDFETRSRADLKKIGGRRYALDRSTEVMCAVLCDIDTREWDVWLSGDPPPAGPAMAAHNGRMFDRFVAERFWGRTIEVDTMLQARKAGLPGALDALGQRWLRRPKDKQGNALTLRMSQPSRARATRGCLPDFAPHLERIVEYCRNDVEIMADGWPRLRDWLDVDADAEAVDLTINDRGVYFDAQLAAALLDADAANVDAALAASARELGWSTADVRRCARSVPTFCEITGLPDARADTIAGHDHPLVRARQALATIARGKIEAGIQRVSDDSRLRDTHAYYGAGTGRWSGRGMQLQNLPRPDGEWTDDDVCRLADRVLRERRATPAEIDVLLRGLLCAAPGRRLLVIDYTGVEARVLAWLANDTPALDVFASGADPYRVMAATIFGCRYDEIGKDERRQVGKIAELACGYGMGATKFERTAAAGGSDLATLGVDSDAVVKAWRRQHRSIVQYWYACEDAWKAAAEGHDARVGDIDFVPWGDEVRVYLPSTRPIVYPEAGVDADGRGSFRGTDLKKANPATGREEIYGGRIVENVVQAVSRDLLADALVRAERAGLAPVMHVHDESVCEVDESAAADGFAALNEIMHHPPAWARGAPIKASGFTGRRYRK